MSQNVDKTIELKTWVEPSIETLDVTETAAHKKVGRDGYRFADSTRS